MHLVIDNIRVDLSPLEVSLLAEAPARALNFAYFSASCYLAQSADVEGLVVSVTGHFKTSQSGSIQNRPL